VPSIEQTISTLLALPMLSEQVVYSILLARTASTSLAEITPAITALVSPHLTHAIMVEVMVWLSVQQLLHRVDYFYSLS
jgi:hypothetical protein